MGVGGTGRVRGQLSAGGVMHADSQDSQTVSGNRRFMPQEHPGLRVKTDTVTGVSLCLKLSLPPDCFGWLTSAASFP